MLLQLLLAAAVANLTLVASKVGMMAARGSRLSNFCLAITSTTGRYDIRISRRRLLIMTTSLLPQQSLFPTRGFRPDF